MALSGSITTDEMFGRSLTFQWTAWQSVASNSSVINWSVVATGSYSSGVIIHEITAKINGQNVYHSDNYGQKVSAGTVIASGTWYQTHSSDGSGSFNAYIGGGIYYQWAINTEKSGSFTLDKIARASSIGISNDGLYLGDVAVITISAADASFTHDVSFTWGSYGETLATGKTGAKTITFGFAPPEATLAAYIPNDTIGYGTLKCITYSNGTQIGTSEKVFYGKIKDRVIPTLDTLSVSLDNSSNETVKGWGIAVAGITKAKLEGTASGAESSTIKSFEISGDYTATAQGTSLSYTGGTLKSGDLSFNVKAVDSRGRKSAEKSAALTVYPYFAPTISAFTAKRDSQDSSKIVVNGSWGFASVNEQNSVTAKIKYKLKTESTWSTSTSTISKETDCTLAESFDVSKSYDLMLEVTDAVGNSTTSTTRISTQDVLLDFKAGGSSVGIGKVAEGDQILDINEDWSLKTHGSEILDLIDARANTQAQSAISAYVPAIVEETHTITGLGYSFVYLEKLEGYELAAAYSVRTDTSYAVTGIQWNYKNSIYTILLSSVLESGATTNLRLLWVKV